MYLTSDDVRNSLRAGPGRLIIEEVQADAEVKTAGGLLLPQNDKLNCALMEIGRVVHCGPFYHQQSGAVPFDGDWPLKPGTYVYYHPHDPWTLKATEGGQFRVIKSIDVMAYWG